MESGAVIANTRGFNYRMRVNPRGARGTVYVQAEIDGIKSRTTGSRRAATASQPLRIVSMSRNEIERDCLCIFRGNGIYEGDRCPK